MKKLLVLVVDDDEDCRELHEDIVRRKGHEAIGVASGHMALDRLKSAAQGKTPAIDVVISDNMMPGMSGITLLRKIRELEYTQPIIFCSAIFPANIDEVSRQLMITQLVRKPFDFQAINDALQKAEDLLAEAS